MNSEHFKNFFHVLIVIPNCNNYNRLLLVLESLKKQINVDFEFAVVVVDNNSKDQSSVKKLCEINNVYFVEENNFLNSPYSARNRGIELFDSNYVVLLDSSCVPSEQWLSEGLYFLKKSDLSVVSGNIKYDVKSTKLSPFELWDSLNGVNCKKSVKENNYAPGGCLFITRDFINHFGLFEEGMRSGGDYIMTNYSYRKEFGLGYCDTAVCYYPAKKYRALLGKAIRVGVGQPKIWRSSGKYIFYLFKSPYKLIKPPSFTMISVASKKIDKPKLSKIKTIIQLIIVDYLVRWFQFYGNLLHLTGLKR